MKKYLLFIIIVVLAIFTTSCAIFGGGKGKTTATEDTNRSNIANVNSKLSVNSNEKLTTIAGLAYGINYSLNKVNDPPRELSVALDLNQRVMSLSGNPTLEAMKDMQATIDKLTSTLEIERNKGKKMLGEQDEKISDLQNKTKELVVEKDALIAHYIKSANCNQWNTYA